MQRRVNRKSPIRFFGWGNKGRKLSKPDTESGRLKLADFALCVAAIMVVRADKMSLIPEFEYKQAVINSVAIVLMLLSFYNYYHKLCPISRWSRSSWATGMTAVAWTAVPLILYAVGANDSLEKMLSYSAWSTVMWIAFIFCLINLLRVKRGTRAEVAIIEWKMRNQRNR